MIVIGENNENSIYFIQTFIKGKKINIKYDYLLYPYLTKEFEDEQKIKYEISLFKLKLKDIKEKDFSENSIILTLENQQDGYFEAEISDINPKDNLFLFDFKFKRQTFFTEKYPSDQYNLSFKDQYEMFSNLFQYGEKKEITDLVISARDAFAKIEKYQFSFFVSVFSDIENLKEIISYANTFSTKKVSDLGTIKEKKLKLAKNLINSYFLDLINKILKDNEQNEKQREFQFKKMAIFQLYFDLVYQKEKIIDLLNNEHYNIHIYKRLLEKEKEFIEFTLPKNCINKLLTFIKKYEEILAILSYNKDFLEILEIIYENRELIVQKFNEYVKEQNDKKNEYELVDEKIMISDFIKIKISDNMEKIKNQIEKILSFEEKIRKNFVYFSGKKIFLEYSQLFNENNINDLIYLTQLINIINKKGKSYNNESLGIIHNKLMKFAREGKVRNRNLLLFIKDDKFLIDKKKYPEPVPLDILNGIDFEKIDNEFIKMWKEIKWLLIYRNLEKEFYNTVCNLVKHGKDFGKLFHLFSRDKNTLWLSEMNDKFIQLLNEEKPKNNPNFNIDATNLIYNLNSKNLPLNSLVKDCIEKVAKKESVHQIYYKIYTSDKFTVFNDELKNLIFEFYKNNKKFINPLYVGFYLKNNQNQENNEISNIIKKYVIEPLEIYSIKNSEKFILLKIIIENNLLENNLVNNEYIKSTKKVATNVIQNIISGKIKFNLIENFYINGKQKELFNRIQLIYQLIDKELIINNENICKDIIEKNINNIQKLLNDLENVQKKMHSFFPESKKKDIDKINKLKNNIKNNNLFYYTEPKIREEIDKYINDEDLFNLYLDFESSDIFFKIFYLENLEKYKNNEKLRMKETKKEIENLINIFKSNSIQDIDINRLCLLLNNLTKEEMKNLSTEIDKLFEQNKINFIIDKDNLVKELLIVSKKNLIYESADGFLQLIEMTEAEQEDFTHINKTIIKYLKEPTDVNIIEFSLELMKNYEIEFNEDTNYYYLKLLKMLKGKKNIVKFLLDNTLQKFNELIDYFTKMKWDKGNIPCLIECKIFFDKYINKKSTDKEIIKSFINGSLENKTFEENLKKLINSFDFIENVFPFLENN